MAERRKVGKNLGFKPVMIDRVVHGYVGEMLAEIACVGFKGLLLRSTSSRDLALPAWCSKIAPVVFFTTKMVISLGKTQTKDRHLFYVC